mmetsp:Transcript_20526/g.30719  ORF Transcript_20526/g.30719 Transcript_20526/m.30719 type:complete len:1305 (+) Transcript_20526:131-4045(+)
MGDTHSTENVIEAVDDALIIFEMPEKDQGARIKCIEKIWKIVRHTEDGDLLDRNQAAKLLNVLVWRAEALAKVRGWRKRGGRKHIPDKFPSMSSSLKLGVTLDSKLSSPKFSRSQKFNASEKFVSTSFITMEKMRSQTLRTMPTPRDLSMKDSQQSHMDFRTNTSSNLRLLINSFLDRMDQNNDGQIKKYDFLIWAASALSDPIATLEAGSPTAQDSILCASWGSLSSFVRPGSEDSKSRKSQRGSIVVVEPADDEGRSAIATPRSTTTDSKMGMSNSALLRAENSSTTSSVQIRTGSNSIRGSGSTSLRKKGKRNSLKITTVLADEKSINSLQGVQGIGQFKVFSTRSRRHTNILGDIAFIQKCVFEATPVYAKSKIFGPMRVVDGETNKGRSEIKAQLCTGKKVWGTGYFRSGPGGIFNDVSPDFARLGPDLTDYGAHAEARIYYKVCQDTIDEDDIRKMTLRQIMLLLPILLQKKSQQLRKHLLRNMTILRAAFWLHRSTFSLVHQYYVKTINTQAPFMQKCSTVNFFHTKLRLGEIYGNPEDPVEILCPIFPERTVSEVRVIKQFVSGHGPLLLGIRLQGLPFLEQRVIYKPDEVRSDMMIMKMFEIFNVLWRDAQLQVTPYSYTFKIVATGQCAGIMEFIENAVELQDWDTENKILAMTYETLTEFIRSAAGSFVACYIMGCRDRHKSNFMIKEDREFIQIDFKHCFDHRTRGVDAPHFAIQGSMKRALMKRKRWDEFKDLCQVAFRVLRRNHSTLTRICVKLFQTLHPAEKVEGWHMKAFMTSEIEFKALKAIPKMIEEGVGSVARKFKNLTHKASLIRKRNRSRTGSGWGSILSFMPSTPRQSNISSAETTPKKGSHRRGRSVGGQHYRKPSDSVMSFFKNKSALSKSTFDGSPMRDRCSSTGQPAMRRATSAPRRARGHHRAHTTMNCLAGDFTPTRGATRSVSPQKRRNRNGSDSSRSSVASRSSTTNKRLQDQLGTRELLGIGVSKTDSIIIRRRKQKRHMRKNTDEAIQFIADALRKRNANESKDHRVSTGSTVSTPDMKSNAVRDYKAMSEPPRPHMDYRSNTLGSNQSRSHMRLMTVPRGYFLLSFRDNRPSIDDRSDSDLEWDEKHRAHARSHSTLPKFDLHTANLSGSDDDNSDSLKKNHPSDLETVPSNWHSGLNSPAAVSGLTSPDGSVIGSGHAPSQLPPVKDLISLKGRKKTHRSKSANIGGYQSKTTVIGRPSRRKKPKPAPIVNSQTLEPHSNASSRTGSPTGTTSRRLNFLHTGLADLSIPPRRVNTGRYAIWEEKKYQFVS